MLAGNLHPKGGSQRPGPTQAQERALRPARVWSPAGSLTPVCSASKAKGPRRPYEALVTFGHLGSCHRPAGLQSHLRCTFVANLLNLHQNLAVARPRCLAASAGTVWPCRAPSAPGSPCIKGRAHIDNARVLGSLFWLFEILVATQDKTAAGRSVAARGGHGDLTGAKPGGRGMGAAQCQPRVLVASGQSAP